MNIRPPTRRILPSEEGFMLLAAMFLLALFMITLAIALPRMAKEIQRDREVETMERGKQYIRGIRMYYKKFGRYPPNVDALVKTNEIRFLRKKYIDPTTRKDDWKPIMFGQNKAPTAMGFFGQPLAGSMGMGGCNGIAGASAVNSTGGLSTVSGGATDVGASGNIGNCAGAAGTNGTSTDSGSASGNGDASGTAGGSASTGSNNSPSTGGITTTSGSSTNPIAGQTFGGAGIIGFSPNSPKASILVYKKKKHYNEWEFVYDPIMEQMMIPGGGGMPGATPAGNLNAPNAPIQSGLGSLNPAPAPTPPQQ